MNKRLPYFEALATFIGTVVGAGILTIPFAFARSGFLVGCMVMVFVAAMSGVRMLMLAEISLRTEGKHQVPGYIGVYLGTFWKYVSFLILVLTCIGALLIYIIGIGKVLSSFFGVTPGFWSFVFLLLGALITLGGIRLIKKTEIIMILLLTMTVLIIGLVSAGSISFEHFSTFNPEEWLVPYGALMFAFYGSVAIPEVREVLRANEGMMKSVIIRGSLIVFILYLLFTLFVFGTLGSTVSEIATVGIGKELGPFVGVVANLLALVVMSEAFLTIGYGMIGIFAYDIGLTKKESWMLAMVIPGALFLLGMKDIMQLVSVVGGIFMGLQTILIVGTFWRAQKKGTRTPEIRLGSLYIVGWGLIIISLVGVVVEILQII